MALKINKLDLDRKPEENTGGITEPNQESGMMEGVNKFMGNLNVTIENAGKLLGQYNNIKGKLTGKGSEEKNFQNNHHK